MEIILIVKKERKYHYKRLIYSEKIRYFYSIR